MSVTGGTAQASYTYDAAGRLATLGTGAATRHYAYVPGTSRVASTHWNDGTADFLEQDYTYDQYHRLTGIEDAVSYELNARDQRTQTTLQDGTYWQYAYDDLGQVTSAQRYDSADEPILDGEYTYAYDGIGNRLEATEAGGSQVDYIANLLNQYTAIGAEEPTYDADGNLLSDGTWTYTWNGENRLIQATDGTITVEADYDYMGRRIFKKVYDNEVLTTHQRFIYDGYKLIEIRDALNANAVESTYAWQPMTLDVPVATKRGADWAYYVFDGNKNITRLVSNTGAELAAYTYGPFGQTLTATGTWAAVNPFRFSSEYHDDETGLVYYNYRHYNPDLGRWLNRDPIGEKGGENLYGMVHNNTIRWWDYLGLDMLETLLIAQKASNAANGIGHYQEGSVIPTYTPDVGSGGSNTWNTQTPTALNMLLVASLTEDYLNTQFSDFPHAVDNFLHYLHGKGGIKRIDFDSIIASTNMKSALNEEIKYAIAYIKRLDDGYHDFVAQELNTYYVRSSENKDWHFAVGGFAYWGQGHAVKENECIWMKFNLHLRDSYNWDEGKNIYFQDLGIDLVVADNRVGELHVLGLAQEYEIFGVATRAVIDMPGRKFVAAWEGDPKEEVAKKLGL